MVIVRKELYESTSNSEWFLLS